MKHAWETWMARTRTILRNLKKRQHFRYLSVHGWITVNMYLRETGCYDVVWIRLAQHRDQRRNLADIVINLGFHKMCWISCLTERLSSSQVRLCSTELVRSVVKHLPVTPLSTNQIITKTQSRVSLRVKLQKESEWLILLASGFHRQTEISVFSVEISGSHGGEYEDDSLLG
jgi:hypothetical protein